KQGARRIFDDECIVPLLGIEIGVAHKADHAEDAIHGRSDFMTHGSKEPGFRAVRRFGVIASFPQPFLDLTLGRYIAPDALNFDFAGVASNLNLVPRDPAITLARRQKLEDLLVETGKRLSSDYGWLVNRADDGVASNIEGVEEG